MKEEIDPSRVAKAAREAFAPQLVHKKRARRLAERTGAAPSVAESVLGRCRAEALRTDGREDEALRRARKLLLEAALEPGEERGRRAQIQMEGEGTVIDRVRAEANAETDTFDAKLERLSVRASMTEEMARAHPRAFRDGFYAEVSLTYDSDSEGRPFTVEDLRPLQASNEKLLARLADGRKAFTPGEWAYFLVQSVGLDPFADEFEAEIPESSGTAPRARAIGLALLRLVPLTEKGYNLVELGPRGTGKSYLYERAAPRAHLLSGGKASVAKLFVDTGTGEKGLVADQDVVAFDEISSTSFPKDTAVSALRAYMESGQVNRGKTTVEGRASIVMLGNINEPPAEILKKETSGEGGHLFEPLPSKIREDTAVMDRIHAYLPGWEVPKVGPLTEGLGLTTPYLAECLSRLRRQSLTAQIQRRVERKGNLKKRDWNAALKTASGLLKLTYPGLIAGEAAMEEVPRPVFRWALWMGLEARLRVRQQQHRILPTEFSEGDFRFQIDPSGADGEASIGEQVFLPEEEGL